MVVAPAWKTLWGTNFEMVFVGRTKGLRPQGYWEGKKFFQVFEEKLTFGNSGGAHAGPCLGRALRGSRAAQPGTGQTPGLATFSRAGRELTGALRVVVNEKEKLFPGRDARLELTVGQ